MADALMLEVVTPGREVIRETAVAEVQLPGLGGYLGILPGHTPLLTELGIGALSYKKGTQSYYASIIGGFAEVLSGRVTVLAEAAERAEEIDVARARKALEEAERRLAGGSSDPGTDWSALLQTIARARARIEAAAHSGAVAARSGK